MNLKNTSKYFLIILQLATFNQIFASTLQNIDENKTSTQIDGEYLKKFCNKANSDHIKYDKETNSLILYAYPSVMTDFFNALISIGLLNVGGALAVPLASKMYNGRNFFIHSGGNVDAILALISSGFFIFTAAMWYKIVKNYKIRNGHIPYLTFDSKGLKKFDEYVLEWQNIKKIGLLDIRVKDGLLNSSSTLEVSFADKLGDVIFKLTSKDPLLPTSSSQFYSLFYKIGDHVFINSNK